MRGSLTSTPTGVPRPPSPLRRAARLGVALAIGLGVLALPATSEPAAAATVTRVAGNDRYSTAAAIATRHFPTGGSPTVYVATGRDYPDALAAGPVAARTSSPVLLTAADRLPGPTTAALGALTPGRIVVVGGPGAVNDAVFDQLGAFTSGEVARVSGTDRFSTAAALSQLGFPTGASTVFVATGRDFADALSAAPAAARLGAPLLLVEPGRTPAPTAAELVRLGPSQIVVLGGTGAVSSAVATQLTTLTGAPTTRVAGSDRYLTSAAITAHFMPSASTAMLATGATFPDALAAGAAAAQAGAPVLLTPPTCVSAAANLELDRLVPASITVLGGPNALSPAVQQLTRCAIAPKYVGDGPLAAIVASAQSAVAQYGPTCPTLDVDSLVAMMIAPIFKESGAATTAASTPSPMTLSRYDEWNGVRGANTNASGNLGLYAFRDDTTPYVRAYWHPGIGIWQYDSAGVGAPFTAVERMDVSIVGLDVARGMASRYCATTSGIAGQPPSEQRRRDRAWQPWWSNGGCPLCQREYAALRVQPGQSGIVAVAGMSTTGGAIQRSCQVPTSVTPVVCWFIDPSLAQGNRFWVTLNPTGSPGPTVAPTPLSLPFYVLELNGREERHWLSVDTGYDTDISASRALGANARVRPDSANSGLTWAATSGLCDLTTNRGVCTPTLARADEPSPTDVDEGPVDSTVVSGGALDSPELDEDAIDPVEPGEDAVDSTVLEEPLVDHDTVAD